DVQDRACYATAEAAVGRAEGRFVEALAAAERAIATESTVGIANQALKHALVHGIEAALAIDAREQVDQLLGRIEALPRGIRPPFLDAQAHRFRGRIASTAAPAEAEYAAAAARFRELELPFWLGVTLLEHGEWLVGQERSSEAEPLLNEAREIFERLEATPWLARCDALAPARAESVSS